ncbi:M23 peptidase family protein [Hydrogenophaga soli]
MTRHAALALAAVWALGLAGCSSTRVAPPAPVEDRGSARAAPGVTAPAPVTASTSAAAPAVVDLGNQPGHYTVKPGDNLIRIGLESGQNWRDIARWNQLENPNRIEVGQVLRVIPPSATPVTAPAKPGAPVAAAPAPSAPGVATAPVTGSAVAAQPLPAAGAAPAPASSSAPSAAAPVAASAPAPAPAKAAASDDIAFIWPAAGSVVAGFDEQKNKGLGIAGKSGEPVLAAAEGRVVYAGSGLRGYGNLIILKHNNTYLTAYAHNQTLLVKEDQNVKQGQKIAEMGSSDADRVKLHFEIRRNGKPVDPAKFLPGR